MQMHRGGRRLVHSYMQKRELRHVGAYLCTRSCRLAGWLAAKFPGVFAMRAAALKD